MTHAEAKRSTVLIVGAGPAGLMMACQLARFNVDFRIIDKNQSPSGYSGALIIHARSLELFHQLGIAEKALAQGIKVNTVSLFFSRKNRVQLNVKNMGKGLTRFPFLLMLEQSKTERLLTGALRKRGHEPERGTGMLDLVNGTDGITAVLKRADGKQETVKADYLVAADGGKSTVRSKLAIPFIGKTHQKALCIMDGYSDVKLPRDGICFLFSKAATAGFFPISGKRWRIDVAFPRTKNGDGTHTFPEVKARLGNNPHMAVQINPDWFSVFHSHQRYASVFSHHRSFLTGDAAHLYSPVGAQGMNSGLQDAHNLAWKLALVVRGRAKAEILQSYEAERKPLAKRTSEITDWFFRLAASDQFLFRMVRLKVLPLVSRCCLSFLLKQKVKHYIFKRISGIGISYHESPLTVNPADISFGVPGPGDLLPFVFYETGREKKNIQELVEGSALHLFIFSKEGEAHELVRVAACYRESVRVKFIPLNGGTENLYRRLGTKAGGWCLVRPDLYIACCSRRADVASLEKYLMKFLIQDKDEKK